MIAEAVDTVVTLGWALLAWIALMAVAVGLALYAVAVAVWAVTRATVTAARASCAWLSWRLAAESPSQAPPVGPIAPEASQPPSRPAPHWAHTDTEEAA
ncbi:hypothetical protein [Streptomyces sp. NBC_01373]|uniref:hypothetical protein n=1 Tax=Streptomyces sp. NBC_01373 TaxID=2903843 RepID=UPI002252A2F7|nr:hypothetical protein [Streptomyces sp. NBC_01373]MCX4703900.1 hypothetical protein [Streptomyces sp. NBC_01373]